MPLTSAEQTKLDRLKQIMALELTRCMAQGMPPKALVEMLCRIPEVQEGLEMRVRGRAHPNAERVCDSCRRAADSLMCWECAQNENE